MGNYNERHAHPLDKQATKECTKGFVGVTKLVGSYFEPFDRDAVAERILSSYTYARGTSKYAGMAKAQILSAWAASADTGTATHATIESFFQKLPPQDGYAIQPNDIAPYLTDGQVAAFAAFDGWWLWRTEWRVASHRNKTVGVIDAVIYNPELDEWAIVDWKTNAGETIDDSTERSQRMGILPLSSTWADCDLSKDDWQLNVYGYISETEYRMRMDRLFIIHLPSNLPTHCTVIEIPKQMPGMVRAILQGHGVTQK